MFIQLNTVELNMFCWYEKGIRLEVILYFEQFLKNPLASCANEGQNLPAWSQNPLAPSLLYPTDKVCNNVN